MIAAYADEGRFRKHVDMARLRFGAGGSRYFREPLPPLVRELRVHGYRHLAPIANRWLEAYGERRRFPASLREFRAACAAQGQTDPTPLLLRFARGAPTRLHQDLYGALAFPLQMTCFLSRTGKGLPPGARLPSRGERTARAVARRSNRRRARRDRHLSHPRAAGARQAAHSPRAHAARGFASDVGIALRAWRHLSRRPLSLFVATAGGAAEHENARAEAGYGLRETTRGSSPVARSL